MAEKTMPTGPGTFCWFELMTKDTDKARTFYTSLFGWTTQEMPMPSGTYTMWMRGTDAIGGMAKLEGPGSENAPPAWLNYIQVADIETSFRRANELGAKACMPITPIPTMGRFAILTDPTGAAFALYQGLG